MRILAAVALLLSGCVLYDGGTEPTKDAGAFDAEPPDAEILRACASVCPGEELTPWLDLDDGSCMYSICRPSYRHCACPE